MKADVNELSFDFTAVLSSMIDYEKFTVGLINLLKFVSMTIVYMTYFTTNRI